MKTQYKRANMTGTKFEQLIVDALGNHASIRDRAHNATFYKIRVLDLLEDAVKEALFNKLTFADTLRQAMELHLEVKTFGLRNHPEAYDQTRVLLESVLELYRNPEGPKEIAGYKKLTAQEAMAAMEESLRRPVPLQSTKLGTIAFDKNDDKRNEVEPDET